MGWFSSSDDASRNTASTSTSSPPPPPPSGLPLPPDAHTTQFKPDIPKTSKNKRAIPESSPNDPSKPDDWLPVMQGKQVTKYTDPCAHAAKASMKCMDENGYDRGKCMKQFQDYRDCKKLWVTKRRNDRFERREGAFD